MASTGATNETGNVVALDEEQARACWGLVIYPWTLVALAGIVLMEKEIPGRQRFIMVIGVGFLVLALVWALFLLLGY